MSDSLWQKQGETLSHKNACKEFGLTEKVIFDAIKQGKLQYKHNYAHGNPYFKLLRVEVKALALELCGSQYMEEQKLDYELKKVTREINSLKRKLSSLEKEKIKLTEAKERLRT